MAVFPKNQKLSVEIENRFNPFLEKMLKIHGKNLISAMIYGETTQSSKKNDDIHSIFIFADLSFQVYQDSLKIVSKAQKNHIIAPLFMTKEYINSSLDVFPIEFLDMKNNHCVVHGDTFFKDLNIQDEHIRLFCEQQVKGKLVRIRQAYLEVGLEKKGLESLLKESLYSLIPTFRNLVYLKQGDVCVGSQKVLEELCQLYGLDKTIFLAIYHDNQNDEKIGNMDVSDFIEKYLTQIEKLSKAVDSLV